MYFEYPVCKCWHPSQWKLQTSNLTMIQPLTGTETLEIGVSRPGFTENCLKIGFYVAYKISPDEPVARGYLIHRYEEFMEKKLAPIPDEWLE